MAALQSEYLLESLVVYKAGSIFGDIQLPFLNVLAELPDSEVSVYCAKCA